MKIIKLTDSENQIILVNLGNVTHIVPDEKEGSILYTIKESGYFVINVKETINEIYTKIDNWKIRAVAQKSDYGYRN